MNNMDLTRYLIGEVMQSHDARIEALRKFYPTARAEDWTLSHAGQRVQIIKKDADKGGKLEFGTEVITSADGSLSALLGASPGASTAASAMIGIIERCFADRLASPAWQEKIKAMIPSYQQDLMQNTQLLKQVRNRTLSVLQLDEETSVPKSQPAPDALEYVQALAS
jgi:malate dehydrogenase (quinone)